MNRAVDWNAFSRGFDRLVSRVPAKTSPSAPELADALLPRRLDVPPIVPASTAPSIRSRPLRALNRRERNVSQRGLHLIPPELRPGASSRRSPQCARRASPHQNSSPPDFLPPVDMFPEACATRRDFPKPSPSAIRSRTAPLTEIFRSSGWFPLPGSAASHDQQRRLLARTPPTSQRSPAHESESHNLRQQLDWNNR